MKRTAATLKTIDVAQLRLGMFVQRLGGNWLDHPFWKARFELRDAADLARLRASGVKHCVIDPTLNRSTEASRAELAGLGAWRHTRGSTASARATSGRLSTWPWRIRSAKPFTCSPVPAGHSR